MVQFKRWLITAISLLLIIAGLGFAKFTQIKAAIAFGESFPESNETVKAIQAEWSSFQPTVTVVGQIRSKLSVDIRNEVEGILTQVKVGSAAKVTKGDMLAQFNVDTESAQLDAVIAEINLAKLEVKRYADLVDVRASSKEQLDRANAQLAISKARARAIEATIAKKTLRAPFSGYTSIHDLQVGTYLPENTILFNITGDSKAVWVDFNLPQIYANISLGTTVNVNAKGMADMRASADKPPTTSASIVALNQQLDTSSRALQARAEIVNPPANLIPGSIISLTLPSGDSFPAIALPNPAIRYDAFGSFVYVLNKDDEGNYRAARKPVKIASKEAQLTYILSGIDAGELIATVGSAKLFPNLLTYVH
jgi:membrane fusion protein (multidrug efflux system)